MYLISMHTYVSNFFFGPSFDCADMLVFIDILISRHFPVFYVFLEFLTMQESDFLPYGHVRSAILKGAR